MISITTLDEDLRRKMEPRTATAYKRLKVVEELTKAGVPTGIMNAPIIPGLNHHEIPTIMQAAAEHGAVGAGLTVVRLNGSIGKIFEDWLRKNFPDRFEKVWNQICDMHGGDVHDSVFGRRMRGSGNLAEIINQLYRTSKRKYFEGRSFPPYNLTKFRKGGNFSLF
jgi:DNA repair photolyase